MPFLIKNNVCKWRKMIFTAIVTYVWQLKISLTDEDGAMITNVGPLLPDNDCCLEEEAPEVVEATTSGKLTAGGLGEDDLNLLSRIESNSANCSIVLEDMDLTIVCPIFVVVEPFSVVVEELD